MAKDFQVIVHDPERAADWTKIFGTNQVYVKSPIPYRANLPGYTNEPVYDLDLDQYTEEQRQALIQHIADKFSLQPETVEAQIDKVGVPILARHCTAAIHNPLRWF